ncbi:MAG TPA: hypothetical protein VK324_00160 [Tepidisphaeraceae bacterium]|nr:hypothetical protein [Tepidisphaeraceae bacterium]
MQPAKKKTKGRYTTYDALISQTNLPAAKRRKLKIGRGGSSVVPRKFHLSDEEISDLREQYKETKRFPNPHNKGFYYFLIEALIDLGLDEQHPQAAVIERLENLMADPSTLDENGTTAWDRFRNKPQRNSSTAKDWIGRFDQNVLVLQRLTGLTPYGRRLLDVGQKVLRRRGAVIDVLTTKDGQQFLRLSTKSAKPSRRIIPS